MNSEKRAPRDSEPERPSDQPPFRFLRETEYETLTPFLKREHPQTIAVVLSHLPADRASELLAELPPNVQVDVIRRLVDLDEADPRVLREVERGLESWLSQQVQDRRRRAAGLAAVSEILSAASGGTRRNILKNLSRHDRTLAGKLRPDRFLFADLIQLDDAALVAVLRAADPEFIVLALAGARADLVQRITQQLPSEQGRALSKALVHLGPTRLADVEDAQQALADLAVDLDAEGRISLGLRRRISVAA
jgi:flagellar motor switch protein FliG